MRVLTVVLPFCTCQGLSIACSTPEALAWDPDWEGSHEISGRAMRSVHAAGEHFTYQKRCGASSAACSGSPAPAAPCANGSAAADAQAPDLATAAANGAVVPERSPLPTVGHAKGQDQQQQQQQHGGLHLLSKGAGAPQANGVRVSAR